jgi:hypothetical protein
VRAPGIPLVYAICHPPQPKVRFSPIRLPTAISVTPAPLAAFPGLSIDAPGRDVPAAEPDASRTAVAAKDWVTIDTGSAT